MTIDRLLVLLLSLSFLLLAPPAAAHDIGQPAAPAILSEQKGEKPSPGPVPSPDDTALFLLTAVPEAPSPAGTDDSGGHDGLALPAATALPCTLHADHEASSTGLADTHSHRARPWATGPPRA
ncbi:hypothetical protein [Niveispirillum sp. KHB5.9]|uniref:hypothetical protein n=1 Tax=Niveispirillum sp. KHB5.9 TaxID=3400269 RepID=UPI003A86F8F9